MNPAVPTAVIVVAQVLTPVDTFYLLANTVNVATMTPLFVTVTAPLVAQIGDPATETSSLPTRVDR